jgi:hypothetical protein
MQKISKILTVLLSLLVAGCVEKTEVAPNVPRPNYTPQYIAANTGKATFEIPEVLELSQIALGLTSYADKNRTTAYWRQAEAYFAPYRNHPLIAKLGSRVTSPQVDYALRAGAFAMQFDANGKIVDGFYPYRWGSAPNLFLELVADFQDFADRSNFRSFYRNQQATYDQMAAIQARLMPVRSMWTWLENRFPARFHSYKIIFSPLTGGNHNVEWLGDENVYQESLMFVSYEGESNPTLGEGLRIAAASRVVFTEIDHSYVNSMSDTRLAEINEAFRDRSKWATAGNANADFYRSNLEVFNEYMTWAVFTLYAYDTYTQADFEAINRATANFMVGARGFPKYREFNDQLLAYYQANRQAKAKEMYDRMLAWAKAQ